MSEWRHHRRVGTRAWPGLWVSEEPTAPVLTLPPAGWHGTAVRLRVGAQCASSPAAPAPGFRQDEDLVVAEGEGYPSPRVM